MSVDLYSNNQAYNWITYQIQGQGVLFGLTQWKCFSVAKMFCIIVNSSYKSHIFVCRRISRFSGMYHLQLLSIFQSQVLEIKCARPLFSKCTCTKRQNIFQSLEKKTLTQTFSAQKKISLIRGENRPPRVSWGNPTTNKLS